MNKKDMNRLNIRALWLMMLTSVIGAVIFTVVIVAFSIAIKEGVTDRYLGIFKLVRTLLLLLIWVNAIASPLIRYERYRYVFNDEEIRVREGLWWVKTFVIPIERLHQVEMQSGPLDQLFKFTKIIVTTAGGNGVVRFIEMDKADDLVNSLKTRINSYAIKGRNKNPNAFAVKDAVHEAAESVDSVDDAGAGGLV